MIDMLAWAIVAVTIIFAGLPILGGQFTSRGSAYWEDFGIGFTIVCVIAVAGGVGAAVIWAFWHVMRWA
jgi:hypothetical protein